MEQLGTGWSLDIAKQGFGYLLFVTSLLVSGWIINNLYKDLRSCEKQSRIDGEIMTKVVALATKSLDDTKSTLDELIMLVREANGTVQGLGKQIENQERSSAERSGNLLREIRDRRGGA